MTSLSVGWPKTECPTCATVMPALIGIDDLLDELGGVGTDDLSADDAAGAVLGDDLDEAVGVALAERLAVARELHDDLDAVEAALLGAVASRAHDADARLGVDRSRHEREVDGRRSALRP